MRSLITTAALLFAPLVAFGASWDLMPASELLDKPVVGRDGNTIGGLEDLVIDVRDGRVRYAVLGFGGWMGLGEDLYALSLSAPLPRTRAAAW
jgi:hypothetical protein